MKLHDDVDLFLKALLSGVQHTLGNSLVGVYLRGSLAMEDFIPETSDIDVLAVTERPVSDGEYAALVDLHAALSALPNPFANRLEIAYIEPGKPGSLRNMTGRGEQVVLNRFLLDPFDCLLFYLRQRHQLSGLSRFGRFS